MPSIASPTLLIAGIVLLVIGWLLRGWASRHDLTSIATDAATGAAWDAVKKRGLPEMPAEVSGRLEEFKAEASSLGRAKKVAGYAARHVVAQVAGVAGWIGLLAGLVLVPLGVFWK